MLHESYLSDWREPNFTAADEETLKAGKLNTDGPALLDYLRKKTPAGGNTAKINTLIEQLGDDSFEKREKASAELIAMGAAALPQLRQALQSNDTEIQRRAKLCVKAIGQPPDDASVAAAVRLLGWRKPPGTAEVLLTWATRLADDPLGREVQAALAAVAVVDGKPDEALVKALDDKDERRRALAGAALGKDPEAGKKPGRRLYIRGMKVAMKAVQHQGGAKILEREFTDVEYFNRFEDGLFARPR
jgi:HEAT repeat protein